MDAATTATIDRDIDVTQSPYPLTVKGKGVVKELLMAPLTDGDYEQLRFWLQKRLMIIAKRLIPETTTNKDQLRLMWQAALQQATEIDALNLEGLRILKTLDGLARVFYQIIKHNHDDFTFEESKALFADVTNIEQVDNLEAANIGLEVLNASKKEHGNT